MNKMINLAGKKKYADDLSLFFRFKHAVEALCVGKGDVCSRLKIAYPNLIVFLEEDLPEKFREDWKVLSYKITRFSSRGSEYCEGENQGNLEITLKRIKNKTASKMAQLIFDIYDYLNNEKLNG